ncbi:hypothetical protein CWATWH0401_1385 [Crocosphaera watsonii WH 0401]|uniref:Uncharacterized protein n=1 Tax=Crocosphaera watsonii WH 0401 TaxID=555881 RepID=T2JGE2_CROWT|nr:hypothetical protein CWATWH0401_1385 [Crocosphaera watsonii WH 0401]
MNPSTPDTPSGHIFDHLPIELNRRRSFCQVIKKGLRR